jgi:hypothetical protein
MEDAAGTPLPAEKRSRGRSDDFFFATLNAPLLRARGALQALSSASGEAASAFASVNDLRRHHASIHSMEAVFDKLDGRESLASKVLFSVMDESERMLLLEMREAAKRGKAKGGNALAAVPAADIVLVREVHSLLHRAEILAKRIAASKTADRDPVIDHALALGRVLEKLDDDDQEDEQQEDEVDQENDHQEEDDDELAEKPKRKKSSLASQVKRRSQRSQKKRQAQAPAKRGRSKPAKRDAKGAKASKKKKSKADAAGDEAANEQQPQELDDEEVKKAQGVPVIEIQALLKEAESEYEEIRKLSTGAGSQDSVVWESAPNVKDLIASARLEDLECLIVGDGGKLNSLDTRASLHMWWRLAKRCCLIHGLFQLLRNLKKGAEADREDGRALGTLQERYEKVLANGASTKLSFAQAAKYERIGKFLSEFPMFVYQRKWVTQADWFQKVEKSVEVKSAGNGKGKKKNGRGWTLLFEAIPSMVAVSSVFLKDAFLLHEHGFQVFPAMMKEFVSEELIESCKKSCETDGEVVFNNLKDVNARQNDEKRKQISIDKVGVGGGAGPSKAALFKDALTKKLGELELTRKHKVDSMVALLSLPGCKAQLAHTDYTPDALTNALIPEKVPLACLVALTDGTLFDVWPGAIRFVESRSFKAMQSKLNAGDVLLFRGDLVHGGAAWEGDGGLGSNVRIHAYLDVEGVKRQKVRREDDDGSGEADAGEVTYFMNDKKHILKRDF